MPRFRPFIGEPTTTDFSYTESVKVVDSKRILYKVKVNEKLPDLAFYDLEKMVKSTDVKLEPMNPTLFPARSITDVPEPEVNEPDVNEPEIKNTEINKPNEVNNA